MKTSIIYFFLLLIPSLAYSQLQQRSNFDKDVSCQFQDVQTQRFHAFQNLFKLLNTRVKTYHYSDKNQSVAVQGQNHKHFAWKDFAGPGTALKVIVDKNGNTQTYLGRLNTQGQYVWQKKSDWQVVIDSSDHSGTFRHVIKAGSLFKCSLKGLTSCHKVTNYNNLKSSNYHIAVLSLIHI